MNLQPILNLMKRVGHNLLQWRTLSEFQKFEYKKGKEIVSKLDHRAEIIIRSKIAQLFPNHKIWGEELGKAPGNLRKEKFIIIDPIDGTKNYLSNNPLFASQIACVENNIIKWGVINLPALNELFWAEKNKGVFLNKKRISPSKQTSLDLALQCFGLGHDAKNFLTLPRLIEKQLAEPRHYGCAGVHFAFIACGRTDIYIAAEAAFYDMAAGILLAQEAGLSLSTLDGSRFQIGEKNTNLVVANKKLLKKYKEVIKRSSINQNILRRFL